MVKNSNLKKRVRAYAEEHGLKYTAALRAIQAMDAEADVRELEILAEPEVRSAFDISFSEEADAERESTLLDLSFHEED